MKDESISKYWRHIRAILRRVDPCVNGNPQGEGIIERVPYLKPLSRATKIPRVVDVDVIERLYRACDVATWPRQSEVAAPDAWRCALVLFCNYGPRTFD